MTKKEYQTGPIYPINHPHYDENFIWIEKDCPKCGQQLHAWDSGQGCGEVCPKCDWRG